MGAISSRNILKKYSRLTRLMLVSGLCLSQYTFANLPYTKINWPSDEKPHLNNPKIVSEWWFLTGKLTAKDINNKVRHFAYYINFRYLRDVSGNIPSLDLQLTDLDTKKVYGNSIALKDTHITPDALNFKSKNYSLVGHDGQYNVKMNMPIDQSTIIFDIHLKSTKKPLFIGPNPQERGLVTMGNNTNSYYYSLTRLVTDGTIQIGQDRFTINPDLSLSHSWMDHQWGDFSVPQVIKTNPWIWMAMSLEDGTDMNVGEFVAPGTMKPNLGYALANISKPDGSSSYLPVKITAGAKADSGYPLTYDLIFSNKSYHMQAVVPNQDLNGVWMGIMNVNGSDVFKPNAPYAIIENTAKTSN